MRNCFVSLALFLTLCFAASLNAAESNDSIYAYGKWKPEQLQPEVIRLCKSPHEKNRNLAADLLSLYPAYFNVPTVLNVIPRLLTDTSFKVRLSALDAVDQYASLPMLKEIGGLKALQELLPVVIELKKSPEKAVAARASIVAKNVTWRLDQK